MARKITETAVCRSCSLRSGLTGTGRTKHSISVHSACLRWWRPATKTRGLSVCLSVISINVASILERILLFPPFHFPSFPLPSFSLPSPSLTSLSLPALLQLPSSLFHLENLGERCKMSRPPNVFVQYLVQICAFGTHELTLFFLIKFYAVVVQISHSHSSGRQLCAKTSERICMKFS